MKQTIAFRVDSGQQIGTGHVMRCLTLAKELQERGLESIFVCRAAPISIEQEISRAGFQVILLPELHTSQTIEPGMMHGDFLVCGQEDDARATREALKPFKNLSHLVVDHYGISHLWDKYFFNEFKILKIDDLADRKHLCHGVIDSSYFEDMQVRYQKFIPASAKAMCGPEYAFIRKPFRNLDIKERLVRTDIKKILISFGGNDIAGYSHMVAAELLKSTNLTFKVMGSNNQINQTKLQELQKSYSSRLEFLGFVENPVSVFMESDLYIGAGGTTTWERFAAGLPGIVYSISENQIAMSRALDQAKFQIYAGEIKNFRPTELLLSIEKMRSKDFRNQEIEKMRSHCDGCGAKRVYDEFFKG